MAPIILIYSGVGIVIALVELIVIVLISVQASKRDLEEELQETVVQRNGVEDNNEITPMNMDSMVVPTSYPKTQRYDIFARCKTL